MKSSIQRIWVVLINKQNSLKTKGLIKSQKTEDNTRQHSNKKMNKYKQIQNQIKPWT